MAKTSTEMLAQLCAAAQQASTTPFHYSNKSDMMYVVMYSIQCAAIVQVSMSLCNLTLQSATCNIPPPPHTHVRMQPLSYIDAKQAALAERQLILLCTFH